ncbi:MAG: hypothetical protein AAF845_15680 [Bacteroidota bacterium]
MTLRLPVALLLALVLPEASAQTSFPPAAAYHELLQTVDVDGDDGRFLLRGFIISFAEDDQARAVLRDANGEQIWRRDYVGQNDGTRTALRFVEAPSGGGIRAVFGGGRNEPPHLTETADYVLEVEHGGRVITRFPFRAERIESDDPYADTQPRFVLTGPWQTHGYADFETADTGREPAFQWNYYTQVLDPEREFVSYEEVRWELRRDGRLIARSPTSDQAQTSRALRTQQFRRIENRGGGFLEGVIRRDDLTDGTYEVRRVVNADSYNGGPFTQTATFEIRNGRFVPVGHQVREGTSPEDFVEGLNRAFFYPFPTSR